MNNSSDTADYFADFFSNICSPNDPIKDAAFKESFEHKKKIFTLDSKPPVITVQLLSQIIDKLALNKSPGRDNVVAEHLKYAHPSVQIILVKLFEIILDIGIVPDDFGLGVTTPLPKFKGSKKKVVADDFRGITINPLISKIFENCLLPSFSHIKTSNRQFGFKKGVGCNTSIHTLRKVINFFNARGSTVNLAAIDLKKAFDKVNLHGLLNLLIDKKVNSAVISVLEN